MQCIKLNQVFEPFISSAFDEDRQTAGKDQSRVHGDVGIGSNHTAGGTLVVISIAPTLRATTRACRDNNCASN